MKYFAFALAFAALTGAQTPTISIRPHTKGPGKEGPAVELVGRMGAPILGYMTGPGVLDLRMIVSTAKGAQQGSALAVPEGATRLYLPPREHYLLLEGKGNVPLALWVPTKADSTPATVNGTLPHPDSIVFSARGDAAVFYAKLGDRLQIASGLPAEPVVTAQPGLGALGEPKNFAVSDDGAVVVALLADGTAASLLHGGGWQRLPAAYGARAVQFVPRTHNLVVSDAAQQTITLVSNVAENTQAARILAHGVVADRLAFTKEGFVLLAASSSQGKLWTVDLKTMTAGPVSSFSSIDTLTPLRDGHTFLLSSSTFSLMNVPLDSESAVSTVTH